MHRHLQVLVSGIIQEAPICFSAGGASQECGGGISHLLLCTVVCSLDGRTAGIAAGR